MPPTATRPGLIIAALQACREDRQQLAERARGLALLADTEGIPRTTIANALGVHRATIARWNGQKDTP